MPRKTTKKTTRKKSPARSKANAGRSPKSTTSKMTRASRSPLYVLVIMGLVTAIALMLNRYYIKQEPQKDQATHSEPEKAPVQDKRETKQLPEEEENKTDKPEKTEKSESLKKEQQAKTPAKEEVRIYFVKFNEKSEKMLLTPVTRKIGRELPLENTMRELIKGPNAAEKKKGLLTAVPSNLRINGIRLKGGTAEIDFNGAIEQGAGGSVLINRIDQIVYTATQFPQVKSIVIKINGRPRQTLGTDGLSIGGPLHRRQ